MLLQKTFFGKVKKNSSKWIKSSETLSIMKTEVCEKKYILNFHKKKLWASKKNSDLKNNERLNERVNA